MATEKVQEWLVSCGFEVMEMGSEDEDDEDEDEDNLAISVAPVIMFTESHRLVKLLLNRGFDEEDIEAVQAIYNPMDESAYIDVSCLTDELFSSLGKRKK